MSYQVCSVCAVQGVKSKAVVNGREIYQLREALERIDGSIVGFYDYKETKT